MEDQNNNAGTAAVLHLEATIPMATKPSPANGAQEVTMTILQWTAGDGAVSHQLSLGTSPTLGATDVVAANLSAARILRRRPLAGDNVLLACR